MKKVILLVLLSVSIFLLFSSEERLTVSYLERPPYYFTENEKAGGFLIDLSGKIFKKAGIEVEFVEMPPKRIMAEIKRKDNFHCSVGWFKKAERERFAKFSRPIYQNKPIVILTAKKNEALFSKYKTLKEVFSDKSLLLGVMADFSYGEYIDNLIEKASPQKHVAKSRQRQLPNLIYLERIQYFPGQIAPYK